MRIVIVERDPFVRADLSEALIEFAAADDITTFETAGPLLDQRPFSLLLWDAVGTNAEILSLCNRMGAAVICTNDPSNDTLPGITYLPRPFTDIAIRDVVKRAIKMEQSD
ncbi:hypothetical protein [Nereida sp. MMG025]|uniref:hypothetical protein n=1 Tax=Nereida sp. MMG025 TaxID=2909981 RepID=UPI001F2574DB|nr:hypothetical protein [Nereida sp. MMG025]MCF6445847.1 hypothetical protein [Nereida sp. MMG025]